MTLTFHLYQLQKIDFRCDQINQRLNEIKVGVEDDEPVIKAELQLKEHLHQLSQIKMNLVELEEKIRQKRVKQEQSEASLYGGSVKNPKGLQDLQKEILSLKQAIQLLEDQQMEMLFKIEEFEEVLKNTSLLVQNTITQNDRKNASFLQEKDKLLGEFSRFENARILILEQISNEFIEQYEKLRRLKKGIAVAGVEEQCCAVCGNTLTPADCQAAKSSDVLLFCGSCGRILYAG